MTRSAPRRAGVLAPLALCALALLALRTFRGDAFVAGAPGAARASPAVALRAAFESGKVNVGAEIGDGSAAVPPEPVMSCDTSCMSAIEDCLDEGCSVEALMKLDQQLASDEKKVEATISKIKQLQKTEPVPEAETQLAWLDNFLSRTSALRGQLLALKPIDDTPFVQKIVKAASVAFGGGRPTDYPKVGVSSYSA
mmetsp:Transcript_38848/g.120846  ORF Transcript_38848/g.120846 Transcript_38848/m.120846 type:complete len:196 (+) Transcript_38848:88-675(+)